MLVLCSCCPTRLSSLSQLTPVSGAIEDEGSQTEDVYVANLESTVNVSPWLDQGNYSINGQCCTSVVLETVCNNFAYN